MLVVAGCDKVVRVYNVVNRRLIRQFYGNKDKILSVAFSYDGSYVASGGVDCVFRIYSLNYDHI